MNISKKFVIKSRTNENEQAKQYFFVTDSDEVDNVDLTSMSFSLENYISFSGCMYTSEMDVRGNIESKLEQFFWN